MGRRLTYRLSDLRKLAQDVPYLNLPKELLNSEQLARREAGEAKFNEAYSVYRKEKMANGKG